MRVLIYSWPFAPMIGGLERLSEMTARQLVDRGHDVVVVTASGDPGDQREQGEADAHGKASYSGG